MELSHLVSDIVFAVGGVARGAAVAIAPPSAWTLAAVHSAAAGAPPAPPGSAAGDRQ
jgi:hypothetical protein